jgi:hypothetical protein
MNETQNSTLIVTRDGQLDKDYYNQIRFNQRRSLLKARSREVAAFTARTPIYALKVAVFLLDNSIKQANEYNRGRY